MGNLERLNNLFSDLLILVFGAFFIISYSQQSFSAGLKMSYQIDSFAAQIKKISTTEADEIKVGYYLVCVNDQTCQNMCQSDRCLINLDVCDSCISSNRGDLYSIFHFLNQVYEIEPYQNRFSEIMSFISNKKIKFVDYNSILNLYLEAKNIEMQKIFKNDFTKMCPSGTDNGYLGLSEQTVRNQSALIPSFLVCEGDYGNLIYKVKYNSSFYHEQNN